MGAHERGVQCGRKSDLGKKDGYVEVGADRRSHIRQKRGHRRQESHVGEAEGCVGGQGRVRAKEGEK